MRAFAAVIVFVAVSLGVQAGSALADEPPKLNVRPSCEAAARGSVVIGRSTAACLDDENGAFEEIKKNWSSYARTDRDDCVGMVKTGGPASYVELISCLNITRDARTIRGGSLLAGPLLGSSVPSVSPEATANSENAESVVGPTNARSTRQNDRKRNKGPAGRTQR
jgi:hypothetical protein